MQTDPAVERLLAELDHPLKPEIVRLRRAILDADPRLREQVKWNAPSFGIDGDDRVTFKLHPPKHLQLILHRGAKVKDAEGFAFEDESGLVRWLAPDRGMVVLRDAAEVSAREAELVELVRRWVAATA